MGRGPVGHSSSSAGSREHSLKLPEKGTAEAFKYARLRPGGAFVSESLHSQPSPEPRSGPCCCRSYGNGTSDDHFDSPADALFDGRGL